MHGKRNSCYFIGAALLFCLLCIPSSASAQNVYNVDCSNGTQPFTTINSVLPLVLSGDYVLVTGTCREDVSLNWLTNVYLGAPWGQTMNLLGSLSISDSQGLFIYGMNITSATTGGIAVHYSHDITINSCASNNNSGYGLLVDGNSAVSVENFGSFSNNSSEGIHVEGASSLSLFGWGGLIDISNNVLAGIYASRGDVNALGNVRIANNKAVAGSPFVSGFGVDFRGAARGLLLGLWGPFSIEGNDTGGISLQENSELSVLGGNVVPGWTNIVIQSNASTGVSVAFGSQVTFYSGDAGIQVLNHSVVGVDVYANSQAFFHGDVQVVHNGFGPDAMRAGLRIDGNSEAFMQGGDLLQNGGPGILALVNSSVDFSGVVFRLNANGPIVCDSSAYMVSDLINAFSQWGSVPCKVPHSLGNHRHFDTAFHVPDWTRNMTLEKRYAKVAVRKH